MAYTYYNPNPVGRMTIDCVPRAIAKALDTDWESASVLLANAAIKMGSIPNANDTWGAVLRQNGFYREGLPKTCDPDCYKAEDFCNDHQEGIYVLGFGNHVATVVDGVIYDTWDSSREVPQYFWYRKEK
jgi:hypothetical protein